MPVVRNSGYNDAGLAQAFGSIASIFAPPDPQDVALYADAALKKQKYQSIASFLAAINNPETPKATLDRYGIGAGMYSPNQGYEAMALDDATKRYGYDQTYKANIYDTNVDAGVQRYGYDTQATTQRQGNMLTAQTSALSTLFPKLAPGEIRPDVPAAFTAPFGYPEAPQVGGLPKPLSETEVIGHIMQTMLSPEEQRAKAFGTTPVENIVGADGKPVIATRPQAIGRTPVLNEGATGKAAVFTAVYGDGRRLPAVQMPGSREFVDPQTGAPIPSGFEIMEPSKATGTLEDVTPTSLTTGARTNTQTSIQSYDRAIISANRALDLLKENPGALGAVGWGRTTLQNLVQSGNEAAAVLQGDIAQTIREMEQAGIDRGIINEMFNSGIVATRQALNKFVWDYAKAQSGDRVSNEQFNQLRNTLGISGMVANNAQASAAIIEALKGLEDNRRYLSDTNVNGVPTSVGPAANPADEELLKKYGVGP